MDFELRYIDSGKVVHHYRTQGAALAFVRDVIRIGGRDEGRRFSLEERQESGDVRTIASGTALVQLALEDRVE